MSRFMTIKAEEIAEAFETERRQYFVGNLKRPQHIPFVKSETTEMGLTAYDTQILKHHYAYFGGDAAKRVCLCYLRQNSVYGLRYERNL